MPGNRGFHTFAMEQAGGAATSMKYLKNPMKELSGG